LLPQVAPLQFTKQEDKEAGIKGGKLQCPERQLKTWLAYHFACTRSMAEKEALMDMSLAMLEEAAPVDTSIHRHQ
jgi:hypothetical protein